MKKKIKRIFLILLIIILVLLFCHYIRVKTAKVKIVLNDDLNIEVNSQTKVSSLIKSINGKLINDYLIDTSKLGKKKITFTYINNEHIKLNYTFQVKIIDDIKPLIWLTNNYYIPVNSNIDLTKKILCGDNYDNTPQCHIKGDYNPDIVGNYNLTYEASDKSGNKSSQPFTLHVYKSSTNTGTNTNADNSYIDFNDIITTYKNKNTSIGLDISKHQENIDFSKLKSSGVEFVFIRVGYGYNNKYFLDNKFKNNIKAALKNKIPVGVYYYSYATSSNEAKKDAEWVIKQIKPYKISLPVAIDWENWSNFNEYHLSFFNLTSMAEDFLQVIEKHGYTGMLYSSKTYLENIWFKTKYPIWLAQYNNKVTYTGKYKAWQVCENGKVSGINTLVDIDVMNK